MRPLLECCAGLDVHRDTVVATVRTPDGAGGRCVVTETFAVTTPTLLALRDWLQAQGVTHVALESTGVYWKPIYYVLEDAFTLILVNMQHLRHVPGRKSDVRDSEWLAQLLECGLLRGSFIPPSPIRDLRDLTRYRRAQLEDRTREVNRLHKLLIDAGLKLSSVLTDIMGMSGRAIVRALVEGTTDPEVLADLARGKLRAKLPALRTALQGRFRRTMPSWRRRSSTRSPSSRTPLPSARRRSTACWSLLQGSWRGSPPFRGFSGGRPKSSSQKPAPT
jgi:transposase